MNTLNTQGSKTTFLRWLIPALVVYIAGFALGTMYDLSIDIAVYSPQNFLCVFMEAFGWYPNFLPTVFLALLLLTQPGVFRQHWWLPVAATVVALGGFGALYYMSAKYLRERGWLTTTNGIDPAGWLWLAVGVLFAVLMLLFARRLSQATRTRLFFFGAASAVYTAVSVIVVNGVKIVWARTRFDDMMQVGSFDTFTPWYLPFGNGGSSFPSGHVANAAGIFVLLILCDLFPGWAKRRKLVTAACWVWIVGMAAARIVIGRHFLSDTLAASGIMALLFLALRHNRFYEKYLDIAARRSKEQLKMVYTRGDIHAV